MPRFTSKCLSRTYCYQRFALLPKIVARHDSLSRPRRHEAIEGNLVPLRSCPRMKLAVDFFESRLINVSIDLRRGDAGMAQEFLDLPQISAAGE